MISRAAADALATQLAGPRIEDSMLVKVANGSGSRLCWAVQLFPRGGSDSGSDNSGQPDNYDLILLDAKTGLPLYELHGYAKSLG